jgi:hypothetical protein
MSIEFSCQQCGRQLRVDDSVSGKQARCPNCSHVQTVPMLVVPNEENEPPDAPSDSVPKGTGESETSGESPFAGDMPFPRSGGPQSASSSPAGDVPTGDTVNPYQTPQMADPTTTKAPQSMRISGDHDIIPTRVTFSALLDNTVTFFQREILGFILIGVAFFVLAIVIMVFRMAIDAAAMADQFDETTIFGMYGGIFLLQTMVQLFFFYGALLTILHMARGGGFQFGMLFSASPMMMKGIGLGILYSLLSYIGLLPMAGVLVWYEVVGGGFDSFEEAMEGEQFLIFFALMGCGLLAIAWTFFITLRFLWSFVVLADKNCGVIESLRQSWRISRSNSLTLILAMVLLAFISLGVYLFTCGLGIIVVIPFMFCGLVVTYMLMAGQPSMMTPGWQPDNLDFFVDDQQEEAGESPFQQ